MRAIVHVDMDAFFASVEQNDRPELRGKPLIVGGDSRRGVAAAASYEARKFGVRSAMPTREALQRCPELLVVPPRMNRYREVSEQVFEIFHEYTPQVEGLSLDEAFLDVTASQSLFGSAVAIGRAIKEKVRERTGLNASVGIAHNKLLAKIASDLNKPDGFRVIEFGAVRDTLDPLPIGRLPGVGTKTGERLLQADIRTFGDLCRAPDHVLIPIFGRHTAHMRGRAAGLDERSVVADSVEQQISAEETYEHDVSDLVRLRSELAQLADRVGRRLRGKALDAGSVIIKVRRSDFSTYTRTRSFEPPTADTGTILGIASELLDRWQAEHPHSSVRLLGVGVGSLVTDAQLDLFAPAAAASNALSGRDPARAGARIDPALDEIRARFGESAVRRGSSLDKQSKNDGFTDARRR